MKGMDVRVQQWGNSLAVRIPKPYAQQMELNHNTPVTISLEGSRLIIEPAKRPTLSDLLEGITPDNIHGEVDMGGPVGNEVW